MESHLRLITFGCSQTYGHCLPDCYVTDKFSDDGVGIAPNPSRMAFPQLIGDYLGLEVHNLAWPGGSNRNMWYEIMHFDFEPTDRVICVWTFPNRSMTIRRNEKTHVGMWPSVNNINKAFQKYIATCNSDEDLELTSYGFIDHVQRYLSNRVQTLLHYKVIKADYTDIPAWADFRFMNALDCIVPFAQMDLALDNRHYGVESHKMIARQMIQDLTIAAN